MAYLPIKKTLQLIKNEDVIITDRPILFQLLGPEKLFVVDITMIGNQERMKIDSMLKFKNIYLMKDEEDDDRYENKNKFLNENKFEFIEKLSRHYNLLKLR
ncbi:MAG: hypothetical protein ABI760_11855 [Ferruginibacter sp.]